LWNRFFYDILRKGTVIIQMNDWSIGGISMKSPLAIVAIVVAVISVLFGSITWNSYNTFTRSEITIEEKYNVILSKLQLRSDATQQLVASINGLQTYAAEIYEMVTSARTKYLNAVQSGDQAAINEAENDEVVALVAVLALVEAPIEGISVTGQYQTLLDSVLSFEYQLDVARQRYNEAVADFNTSIRLFPRMLFASMLGFGTQKPYWEVSNQVTQLPVIAIG
jgi:LemA protein